MIGKTISHYKILEKLGEGGMGVVYKAEDTKLRRTVALKFLPPGSTSDPQTRERFIREAQAASALEHPNICNVHEIDETKDGQLFICMACYDGESLRERISRGPLRLEEALDIGAQVALGLSKAHEKGIVHRDIKPANILITTDGHAKILDFGLAKLAREPRLTRVGSTTGTVAYMSPEQTRGEDVDRRTDVWALGVVLYEMITGLRPFKGDHEQATVFSIANEEPEPVTALRTGVPMELERIILKAMAKSPGERYRHIDDMMVDLRGVRKKLNAPTVLTRVGTAGEQPSGAVARALRAGLRRRLWVPVAAAVVVVLAFFALRPVLFDRAFVADTRPIVVISFENQTGDDAYDYLREAIPNLLITNLERSKYLRVTTWERMHDLLKQIDREDVEFIDRELGFELCRMEGVDSIVLGSFTKAGDTFATDVKVLDVGTKKLLGSTNARGEGIASILKSQIDELSRNISREVGIPERAVESSQPAVVDVTTSSMDAYNHFLTGRAYWRKHYYTDAVQSLERAVEIDPTFAAAHLFLGWSHWRLNDTNAQNEALETARRFAEKATERERLWIEAWYATFVEGDLERALRILHVMRDKFPREKLVLRWLGEHLFHYGRTEEAIAAWNRTLELDLNDGPTLNSLAYAYANLGDLERALEYAERQASALPGDANPLDTMAEMYFRMGRADEAIATYEQALAIKPDFMYAEWGLAYVHALREDYSEAMAWTDRFVASARSPASAASGHMGKAFLHFWLGDSDSALRELETAQALARTAGDKYWEDEVGRTSAWMYYYLGEPERGRVFFENWVCAPDEPSYPPVAYRELHSVAVYEVERSFHLGLADLHEGRIASARSRLAEMKSRASEEDLHYRNWIPLLQDALHAQVLLEEGSLDEAVRTYEEAPVPQVPALEIRDVLPYNVLFMRDALARAYVRNGEPDRAIAEYERLLTFDPESSDRRLIHPTYHYRLAVLYEEKGQTAKATSEYERFLEIWKDADEGLPEVVDAKARLAALEAA